MAQGTLRRVALILLGLALSGGLASLASPAEEKGASGVTVDREKRTVTVAAKVAPRKIDDPRYKEIYPVEVFATFPFPRGKKAHETVVTFESKPSEVHKALESLGLKPGKPARTEKDVAEGPEVRIFVEAAGKRVPIDRLLVDRKSELPMPKVKWLFTGSVETKPDPDKDEKVYGADLTGTLIAIFPVTAETVFQSSLTLRDEKYVKLETNKKLLPAEGTAVKLVIVAPEAK
jgi:hypothetical protein